MKGELKSAGVEFSAPLTSRLFLPEPRQVSKSIASSSTLKHKHQAPGPDAKLVLHGLSSSWPPQAWDLYLRPYPDFADFKTEIAKMTAQGVSEKVIVSLLGHSAGNAARFNAFVDLQCGWDAFVRPLLKDFSAPAPQWPTPLPYSLSKNGSCGQ